MHDLVSNLVSWPDHREPGHQHPPPLLVPIVMAGASRVPLAVPCRPCILTPLRFSYLWQDQDASAALLCSCAAQFAPSRILIKKRVLIDFEDQPTAATLCHVSIESVAYILYHIPSIPPLVVRDFLSPSSRVYSNNILITTVVNV